VTMKAKTLILISIAALLIASNFYTYVYFACSNGYLKFTLQQIATRRNQVLAELSELKYYAGPMREGYSKVIEANKGLEEVLTKLREDLINVPYSYTIMSYEDFTKKFLFAYTDEMKNFVLNITDGWDGTDEDFRSDLYKIYKEWRSAFKYASHQEKAEGAPSEAFLFINIGGFNYGAVEVYSFEEHAWIALRYLKEVPFGYEVRPIEVSGAPISFRNKRGVCWDFAVVLVALYYAYYDLAGKSLPTIYVSIQGIDGDPESHAVVLIKLEGDRVAIMDWEVITPLTDGMVEFVPFETAKKLHVEYWRQVSFKKPSDLLYRGFMKGRPYEAGVFYTNEEFYEWLVREFK